MPARHAERATAPTDSSNSPIGINGQRVRGNSFHNDRHPEDARLKATTARGIDALGFLPEEGTL